MQLQVIRKKNLQTVSGKSRAAGDLCSGGLTAARGPGQLEHDAIGWNRVMLQSC